MNFFVEPNTPLNDPILSQYVTTELFRMEVLIQYPAKKRSEDSQSDVLAVTPMEEKILRYVAGYVCRHVKKKLEESEEDDKDENNDWIHF